jgi:hypothetical protein
MIDYLIRFFRTLNEAMPPPTGKVHAIAAAHETVGASSQERLVLIVSREIKPITIYLEHHDFKMTPDAAAQACAELVHQIEKGPDATA